MRLAFMGTPDFAIPALLALHREGHDIVAVYSQPPKPAGRGQAMRPSPVQYVAEQLGLAVRTPIRLKLDLEAQAAFAALDLDAAVVAAYGLILPQPMLTAPRRGCLNIHASLLPRWRGASPIQAAILAGDAVTGITIMQMEAGLDTGPMLARATVPIDADATAASLHDQLAALGARLILQSLDAPQAPVPQPEDGACYAPRLTREDGHIDWREPAGFIDRRIRAMTPWPGAFTRLNGTTVKIMQVTVTDTNWSDGPAGTVLDDQLTIACGTGRLRIDRLQWPGRVTLDASIFLNGRPIPPGTHLG